MLLVPELSFSATIMWNGEGNHPSGVAVQLMNHLYPKISDVLNSVEEKNFPPLSPVFNRNFVGIYLPEGSTSHLYPPMDLDIINGIVHCYIGIPRNNSDVILLRPSQEGDLIFQVSMPFRKFDCVLTFLKDYWVFFTETAKNVTFRIPCLFYDITYVHAIK